MKTNWNVIKGNDGKDYLEAEFTAYVPPGVIAQGGATIGGIPVVVDSGVPVGGYTLESVAALRDKMWVSPLGLDASKITSGTFVDGLLSVGYDSLVNDDGIEVRRDSGPIDELNDGNRLMWPQWQTIVGGSGTMGERPKRDRSEPEHPSGRFRNLDWEEAS